MLVELLTLGALGSLAGAGLGIAAKKFHVEVDPRIKQIDDVLPHAQCGACGYPGCVPFATAVVEGEAPANGCMADFRARFVFDADGSIIPCPSLQGGEMAYGHVTTGVDFVAESQLLKRRLPDKCLNECPILPVCMGGCRLQALVNGNGFNGIDCHYEIHRLFVEEYIRERASSVSFQEEDAALKKAA